RKTPEAKEAAKQAKPVSADPAEWKLKLVVSTNGVKYDLVRHLGVPGHPNETTLRFLPDGDLLAMVRRGGGAPMAWPGIGKAPYKEWHWIATGGRFGGPNFIVLPDGRLVGSSRRYPGGAMTGVGLMTRTGYEPSLILPSGGDTSYAGLVWHEGLLWV